MLVNKLLERMSKQGSQKRNIKILLNKVFYYHFWGFLVNLQQQLRASINILNCKHELKYKMIAALCLIVL